MVRPLLAGALLLASLPAALAEATDPVDSALLAIAEDICLDLLAEDATHRRMNVYQLAALTGANPRDEQGRTILTLFDSGIAYCRLKDKSLWASFSIDGRVAAPVIAALESPPVVIRIVRFRRLAPPSSANEPTRLSAPVPSGPGARAAGGPVSILPDRIAVPPLVALPVPSGSLGPAQ